MKIFIKNKNLITNYIRLYTDEIYSLNEIKNFNDEKILIIGNFDNLHLGHFSIINEAIKFSKIHNKQILLYSIINHNKKIGLPLSTISEKIAYFKSFDIDYLYLEELKDIEDMSATDFFNDILIKKLNISDIFCGFNFSFGKNREGNVSLIRNLSKKYNINVNVIDPIVFKEEDNSFIFLKTNNLIEYIEMGYRPISSTYIKENILKKNIEIINKLLATRYKIIGEIKKGKQLGRLIGFPTANLETIDKSYPKNGVYGVKVKIENYDKIFYGVTNIGNNPTIENQYKTIETNIFDFSDNIYGSIIELEFITYIRNEIKFNNLDELKEQIKKDVLYFKEYIRNNNV